jgi:hypothetical protein
MGVALSAAVGVSGLTGFMSVFPHQGTTAQYEFTLTLDFPGVVSARIPGAIPDLKRGE